MAVDYNQMVLDAYADIGRTGVGGAANQIDPEGLAYWTDRAQSEGLTPDQFGDLFGGAVTNYFQEKPQDQYTDYVTDYLVRDAYSGIGREGIGGEPNQIDQEGYDFWKGALTSGDIPVNQFGEQFTGAVQGALEHGPNQAVNEYVANYLRGKQPTQTTPQTGGGAGGQLQPGAGVFPTQAQGTPYLSAPTNYGGSDGQMMDVGGQYVSPLIQALRQQSNEAYSTNPGVQRYANLQPSSGGLTARDPNRASSIFSPEVSTLPAYDMANDPRAIQIGDLYQQVLGREADQPGLQNFVRSNMTMDQIRNAMVTSPEYLSKNPEVSPFDYFQGTVGGGN